MSSAVPQAGSAFEIAWLLADDVDRTSSLRRVRPTFDRSGLAGASILVVDDDDSIRGMLSDVLRSCGYSVQVAGDGESALAAIEAERPALVLLDMRMPKVDGWEFARRLKRRGVSVPIVVMTAVRDARRSAEEIGAAGYLAKPFEIDQLLAQVSRHMERAPN